MPRWFPWAACVLLTANLLLSGYSVSRGLSPQSVALMMAREYYNEAVLQQNLSVLQQQLQKLQATPRPSAKP